jgi:hypothetical protein
VLGPLHPAAAAESLFVQPARPCQVPLGPERHGWLVRRAKRLIVLRSLTRGR